MRTHVSAVACFVVAVCIFAPAARAHHGFGAWFEQESVKGGETATLWVWREPSQYGVWFYTFPLSSSHSDLVPLPNSVTLGNGQSLAISIQTSPVSEPVKVSVFMTSTLKGYTEVSTATIELLPDTPTPPQPPTPPTPPREPLPGDVNGDRNVNWADVAALLRAVGGLYEPPDFDAADVYPSLDNTLGGAGDGVLDLRDAIRLVRHFISPVSGAE
jgi:hypothetical protein